MLLMLATAFAGSAELGGYMRVMTRPDFQGGNGRLGYWNLYGRLLNEGPWMSLDGRIHVLEEPAGSTGDWALVHLRVEGGSVLGADSGNGNLANLRLAHLYGQVGLASAPAWTFQIGSIENWWGDLGLYDMRPSTLFFGTVGGSARYEAGRVDLLVGVGDAGYNLKPDTYNTVFTGGAALRVRLSDHVQVGVGGQGFYEPEVKGNRFAAHSTPGLDYEDWVRGEVIQSFLEENPNQLLNFPDPQPVDARSYKAIGYLGFGGFGPLTWNSLYVSYELRHPDGFTTETYQGDTLTLYVTDLTDERTALLIGNEMQLSLVPGRFDAVWGVLYGDHEDADNGIVPTDHDRWYASTVLRGQLYLSPTVHLLAEGSLAREHSKNGNTYRNSVDSIFQSTEGVADTRGLEYGDSATRDTVQGKGGVVLNPLGPGVYVRPSLRILYGVQYSTQNNAFGNSFVETLDQYNDFGNQERHLHHVVAVETEAWF